MTSQPAPITADTLTPEALTGSRRSWWARLFPYLLVTPTLIFVFVFTIYPAFATVRDSLYEPARARNDPSVFVGVENYVDLFDSTHFIGSRFTRVLSNTLIFSFATVIFSVPLALFFALLLNRKIRAMGFLRFSMFYPALLPLIGAASIWAFLYSDSIGLFNTVMRTFGLPGINWIGDPNMVLLSLIIFNIWKQSGYYMIFYLAGLQNIPKDLYEAADLDGANERQKLRYLTMPLLRRTTLFVLVTTFIFSFQTVEQLQALNQGNPADRGNLLLYFIFQNIGERRNWGYINAMTVVLVSIILVFTIFNFVVLERNEDEKSTT